MFEVGRIYHRRNDIHKKYGGNVQSGISSSAKEKMVFLFTSPQGKSHGYKDGWVSKTEYQYTGEGQVGNQVFTRGNLAIKNHLETGKRLYLFKQKGIGYYQYVGEFEYADYEIKEGLDINQNIRELILFKLIVC